MFKPAFLFAAVFLLSSQIVDAQSFSNLIKGLTGSDKNHSYPLKPGTRVLRKVMSQGGSSISGKIIRPDSGYGSARVTVLDLFGYEVAREEVWFEGSDRAAYNFQGLYPGSYVLRAADYDSIPTYSGNTLEKADAEWISLSALESKTIDLTMIDELQVPSAGIVINGRCFGKTSSDTLKGGAVSFEFFSPSKSGSRRYSSAQVSTDGSFSCTTGVEPGVYLVRVNSLTSSLSPGDFCAQWWNGDPVTAVPEQKSFSLLELKDFFFSPGATITGSVRDELVDTLQSGIMVAAIDEKGFIISSDNIWKEESPEFRIQRLPEGSYRLAAFSSIYSYTTGFYLPSFYNGGVSLSDAELVSADAQTGTGGINISLRRNPAFVSEEEYPNTLITGTVTDREGNPVPFALIEVINNRGGDYFYAYSDQNGVYRAGVKPGIELLIRASIESPHTEYFLASEWFENAGTRSEAVSITLQNGDTRQIDFSLEQGGSMGGFLRGPDGNPLNSIDGLNIGVYAISSDKSRIYGTSGTDFGGFRFTGMKEGSYSLQAVPFTTTINDPPVLSFGYTSLSELQIVYGTVLQVPEIILRAASARISGTIYQRTGTPANLDALYIYNSDSLLSSASTRTYWSNSDYVLEKLPDQGIPQGRCTFTAGPLPQGKYAIAHVSFYDDAVTLDWYGGGSTGAGIYDEKSVIKPFIPPTALWIDISEGQDVTGIDFNFLSAGSAELRKKSFSPEIRISSSDNQTVIKYRLSPGNTPASGSLQILDLRGKLIRQFRLEKSDGTVLWSPGNGKALNRGLYIFRIVSGQNSSRHAQILVR